MLTRLNRLFVIAVVLGLSACAGNGGSVVVPKSQSVSDASSSAYLDLPDLTAEHRNAIEKLERRVRSNPSDIVSNLELAALYRQLERFEESHKYIAQAQTLSPGAPLVLNELAILQRAQGQFKQAEQTYLGLLAKSPEYYDAHFNLGILYDLYLRQPLQAQSHYKTYLASAPEADKRVEKWLVDLQRRHRLDASASQTRPGVSASGENHD